VWGTAVVGAKTRAEMAAAGNCDAAETRSGTETYAGGRDSLATRGAEGCAGAARSPDPIATGAGGTSGGTLSASLGGAGEADNGGVVAGKVGTGGASGACKSSGVWRAGGVGSGADSGAWPTASAGTIKDGAAQDRTTGKAGAGGLIGSGTISTSWMSRVCKTGSCGFKAGPEAVRIAHSTVPCSTVTKAQPGARYAP